LGKSLLDDVTKYCGHVSVLVMLAQGCNQWHTDGI